MKKIILILMCLAGLVSQAQARDSDKESLFILPISGVNLLVNDILDRENIKANATGNVAEDDNSFENFKKKQMEEFEAFKRGGPSPQAIAARKRADAKALADRIEAEEQRLQKSLQWALRDGLQNRYQVVGDQAAARLVAKGSITKREDGYLIAVSIQNASTKKIVYDNSAPCEGCGEIQVGIKFKDLGNVPAPAVVEPVAVAAAPQPPAAPADAAPDNCYVDDFVQVCLTKAEGNKKNQVPRLVYTMKNLTDDTVLVSYTYNTFQASDDAGTRCSSAPGGVTMLWSDSKNEGDYSRIPKGQSLKFNWSWGGGCSKPTIGDLTTSMSFQRLKDGEIYKFSVGIAVTDWK